MSRLIAVLAFFPLCGCAADYLNNYDTVTLAAGDANLQNQLSQTVDPLNPNSNNTKIETDGLRSVAAVQRYRNIPQGAPASVGYQGNCENPGDSAADGSSCGGRAASVKPGGAS
ncbi:MAG: hypothetical protein EOS27_27065 [Mesorhizobium sp.]|nr:MAG: hypothetical protein EOS27_27065 [Mesorhizobium sp.]